jgi:hypothetical protein
MYRFQQRLKNFKQLLKQWNKNCFGDIFHSIQDIESQLEAIQKTFISGTRTDDLMKEEAMLRGTTRRKKKAGGDSMEAEISSSVAQGRGEEHQILSQDSDASTACQ